MGCPHAVSPAASTAGVFAKCLLSSPNLVTWWQLEEMRMVTPRALARSFSTLERAALEIGRRSRFLCLGALILHGFQALSRERYCFSHDTRQTSTNWRQLGCHFCTKRRSTSPCAHCFLSLQLSTGSHPWRTGETMAPMQCSWCVASRPLWVTLAFFRSFEREDATLTAGWLQTTHPPCATAMHLG